MTTEQRHDDKLRGPLVKLPWGDWVDPDIVRSIEALVTADGTAKLKVRLLDERGLDMLFHAYPTLDAAKTERDRFAEIINTERG